MQKEGKEDSEANDVRIDISDRMNDCYNPHPISPEVFISCRQVNVDVHLLIGLYN